MPWTDLRDAETLWEQFRTYFERRLLVNYMGLYFFPEYKEDIEDIELTFRDCISDCQSEKQKKVCTMICDMNRDLKMLPIIKEQWQQYRRLLSDVKAITLKRISVFRPGETEAFHFPKVMGLFVVKQEKKFKRKIISLEDSLAKRMRELRKMTNK